MKSFLNKWLSAIVVGFNLIVYLVILIKNGEHNWVCLMMSSGFLPSAIGDINPKLGKNKFFNFFTLLVLIICIASLIIYILYN